ncbi:hypothetical protein SDJN02_19001, partial [Cucurbita argyrosperma subsp. argyrosperma]
LNNNNNIHLRRGLVKKLRYYATPLLLYEEDSFNFRFTVLSSGMRLLFTFAFSKMMRAFKQPIDQEDLPSSVMLLKRNLKKLLKECTASFMGAKGETLWFSLDGRVIFVEVAQSRSVLRQGPTGLKENSIKRIAFSLEINGISIEDLVKWIT